MGEHATLWRHRDFLKLWGGQSLSIFGTLVGKIALPFLVIYTLQATPNQVAMVRVAEIAPGLLLGLLAGVWIDRLRRKPIMIGADLCRAVLIGSILVLWWLGSLTILDVLLIAALVSILTVLFDVAYEAYVPTLVTHAHIVEANSKLTATASIAEVGGFGIAGVLFQAIGGAFTLLFDAVSFLISAITLALIRTPESVPQAVESRQPIVHEAKAGFRLLLKDRILFTLVGVSSIGNLYGGMLGTIYVLFISRELQIEPGIQGMLYALGGVSSFAGAALAGRLLKLFGPGASLIGMSLLGLVGTVLVPLAFGPLWLIMVLLMAQQVLGDGPDTIYAIHVTSLRQTITPNEFLGRVNAAWQAANWTMMLVGTVAAGMLAEGIGLRQTFFLAVAVRGLGFVWLMLSPIRDVKSMPQPVSQPQSASQAMQHS